jgi:predicted transcriptional regulator
MNATATRRLDRPRSSAGESDGPAIEASPAELLELLNDTYTRQICAALGEAPKPAREVCQACECSRPTVYRRLDRLEAAGIVETTMRYEPDGNHRRVFHLRVDGVTVELRADGLSVEVETNGP